jgi:hypothetical protein
LSRLNAILHYEPSVHFMKPARLGVSWTTS